MQLDEQRAIYTVKSRKAFNTLRTCGIIDLTIGIPLTLLAIGQGVAHSRSSSPVICPRFPSRP